METRITDQSPDGSQSPRGRRSSMQRRPTFLACTPDDTAILPTILDDGILFESPRGSLRDIASRNDTSQRPRSRSMDSSRSANSSFRDRYKRYLPFHQKDSLVPLESKFVDSRALIAKIVEDVEALGDQLHQFGPAQRKLEKEYVVVHNEQKKWCDENQGQAVQEEERKKMMEGFVKRKTKIITEYAEIDKEKNEFIKEKARMLHEQYKSEAVFHRMEKLGDKKFRLDMFVVGVNGQNQGFINLGEDFQSAITNILKALIEGKNP